MIIGLCGKKQCGKSTTACGLVAGGFVELSFAGPLKAACAAIFGFTDEQLNGALKEVPDAKWGVSPRQVMQRFGTDLMRKYSNLVVPIKDPEDIWLTVMAKRIASLPDGTNVVISDVRFENEAAFVRKLGGFIIKIDRPDLVASDVHASEALEFDADMVIVNDGSIADLCRVFEMSFKFIGLASKIHSLPPPDDAAH
jgi:hypothetical protein